VLRPIFDYGHCRSQAGEREYLSGYLTSQFIFGAYGGRRHGHTPYHTDAIRYTQVRVLEIVENSNFSSSDLHKHSRATRNHGDVLVRSQVVGFKKIKFFTNENVGSGNLELPENEMHTTAFWITLGRRPVESLPFSVRERQSGMLGLLHALSSMATLLLMCDRRDLGTAIGERPPSPGLGLELDQELNPEEPCVGPSDQSSEQAKQVALTILSQLGAVPE
jgi:ATP-dependent helicase YprA (DUF1998 family)